MTDHPNSRKVTLFRALIPLNNQSPNDPAVQAYQSEASFSLGPYFSNKDKQTIGSGLEEWEIRILLPHLVDLEPTDKEFRKAVKSYFTEIITRIPFANGLTLEVGLETDNSAPISATNLPLDIADYIKYRHAKAHPWVAPNAEEGRNTGKYKAYIVDKHAEELAQTKVRAAKDEAMQYYMEIRADEFKIDQMIIAIDKLPSDYKGASAQDRKVTDLHDYATRYPVRFVEIYTNGKFQTAFWLKGMIKAKLINQVGNRYVFAANGVAVASSLEDMLLWIEDKDNQETVMHLKQQVQEILGIKRGTANKKKKEEEVKDPVTP